MESGRLDAFLPGYCVFHVKERKCAGVRKELILAVLIYTHTYIHTYIVIACLYVYVYVCVCVCMYVCVHGYK